MALRLGDVWRRLCIRFFGASRVEVDEELSYHITRETEFRVAAGMNEEEARRQALIAFGGVEKAREQCHEWRIAVRLEALGRDIRYALRGLRRVPAFAVPAILTFAVGIGATTAVFSVVDRILFRSLPYHDAGRLVSIGIVAPIEPQEFMLGYSYYEWQDHQTPFETMTSWTGSSNCDLTEENAIRLTCASVEANFLPALGVGPLLGRNFTSEEDRPNAPKVAMISYHLWRSRFGNDPSVVGKTVSLDGTQVRVIGVLNKDFELPTLDNADVLVPEAIDRASQQGPNPGRVRWAFARLKPGVTIDQAAAAMQPLFQQMLMTVPPQFRKEVHLRLRSLRDRHVHDAKLAAWILFAAVMLVLMIACANVGGLLLARSANRQREIAIRSALGASKVRLVRQIATESLVVVLMGSLVGCLMAAILLRIFQAFTPQGIPYLERAHVDPRIVGFAVAASLVCGILFGWAPALPKPDMETLAGRSSIGTPHGRIRQLLVVAQIAVSLVLLAGASLLLRSFWNLQKQPLGMGTRGLVTASISLGELHYSKPEQQMAFFQLLETRLRKLPGVDAVVISDSLPPGGWHHDHIFAALRVEGKPPLAEGTGGTVAWRWVTPDYFRALSIPILRGRGFSEADRNSADHFMILSQSLAGYIFQNENPTGRHVQPGLEGPWYTVVGVAADVKNGGLMGGDEPEYYRLRRNYPEDWGRDASVTVATPIALGAMEHWMRSEIAVIDSTIAAVSQTMGERVSKLADRPRFEAALLGLFAMIGILLAAIGIYGVIAFLVAQRTPEIGVRMAMGATKMDILELMGMQGLRMIAAGTLIGLTIAVAASRSLSTLLFGVRPDDPLSFASVCLLLAFVAGVATWIPASRAMKVDPSEALRHD
ncbi:MAG TPA: ABC transporter permease [Candidatus Sulfotelmatobacter sp.]|nr:ABC transporter permease [Candidatus Sulfotelmatobacter sp.]